MESTIPKLLRRIVADHPELPAQLSKDEQENFQPTTFTALFEDVRTWASGLRSLGVARGDRVGLISDNRREWFVADLSLLALGAADVPRGCDSTADEMAYILGFSECRMAILENEEQLRKILDKKKLLPFLKQCIILDADFDEKSVTSKGLKIHGFASVMKRGRDGDLAEVDREMDLGVGNETATVIFTSGTTGEPKGVMLTHRNFLFQVEQVPKLISVGPEDRWLSVLPVWHSFERIMQYVALGTASTICYSKPIGAVLVEDMSKVRPTWMASVPRIWESLMNGIYKVVNKKGGVSKILFLFFVAASGAWAKGRNLVRGLMPRFRLRSRILDALTGIPAFILLWPLKALGNLLVFKNIKAKLGGRFVAGISGGGGLPSDVDKFFQAAGILLLEGYGLTESGPVLTLRPERHPVLGTIGPPFPGTELKVVDKNGATLSPGQVGVLHARGEQIMKGYYKKGTLTAQVLDDEGYLNTGDLAMMTWDGEVKIVGRAKDTIVLLSGENVEPAPIEEKINESPYISTAMVVGQDRKYLGALIQPDLENLKLWAQDNSIFYDNEEELLESVELHTLISNEISRLVSKKNGFKLFEHVLRHKLLLKPFELGREISAKQEIKRHTIRKLYKKQIDALFD